VTSRIAPILACLAILSWGSAAIATDTDVDGDGVHDAFDVCPNTPSGVVVDNGGRPVANLDSDCDVDLRDFAILQMGFSKLDDLASLVHSMTGPLRCGIPFSDRDIELRFALRRQASAGATACVLPSSTTDYLANGCFLLEVYAADTRQHPLGITCVFFDVDLGSPECPLSGAAIVVEGAFPDFQSGSFASPRRADEVGGCTVAGGIGVSEWALVATIYGNVTPDACSTTVALREAELDSSVIGGGVPAQIGLGQPIDASMMCTGVIYDLSPPGGDGFIDGGDLSVFSPCLGETAPFSQNCDGLDWNCDGSIDEIDKTFFDTAWQHLICTGGIDVPSCQLNCTSGQEAR